MGDTSTEQAAAGAAENKACNAQAETPTISMDLLLTTLQGQLRDAIAARRSAKATLDNLDKQIAAFNRLLKSLTIQ